MARKKMEIKPIEVKSKRHTTFTKRRRGLFTKTKLLCDMADAEAAVVIFSKAGNGFGFGHPAVEGVIDRYLADHPSASDEVEAADNGVVESSQGDGGAIEMEEEAPPPPPPLTEMETRFSEALATGRLPAWDVLIRDLGLKELGELEEAVRKIKSVAAELVKEVVAAGEEGDRFAPGS